MIVLWLLLSVGVGIAVFLWEGCAAAFGWLILCLFALLLIGAIVSC